jgi:hypothetical protein
MPTYWLCRGLLRLSAASIPPSQRRFASSLDGSELFGRPVRPTDRFPRPSPAFVCGASAVTRSGLRFGMGAGLRFGMGAGYVDVEWWIGRRLGLVDDATTVVAVVGACQVSPAAFVPGPDALLCTHLATPDGLFATGAVGKPAAPPRLDFDPALEANPLVADALPTG